ncbi:MAG TPA: hypothetical protein DCY13_25150 [Verrucomicrobiales bacterium]|nr:hypothetical protein [Verrucomicrobiales bacterium]
MPDSGNKPHRPWPLALCLLLPGAAALMIGLISDRGARTNPNDPGPWFLPLILGTLLCLGALVLLSAKRLANNGAPPPVDAEAPGPLTWQFLGGLVAYLWAIPWLGFLLATPVFVWLLLLRLRVPWWQGALAAAGLTLAAQGMFSGIFKVPLPAGIWN